MFINQCLPLEISPAELGYKSAIHHYESYFNQWYVYNNYYSVYGVSSEDVYSNPIVLCTSWHAASIILSNSCHDHHMRYYLTISHALPVVYIIILYITLKVFVIIILLFEHKIQCPYIIHNDSILCMCE